MGKLLPLSLSLNAFLLLTSCGTLGLPTFNGDIYTGSSERGGLYRDRNDDLITPTDPRFNDTIAMRSGTFQCFYETYALNCEKWKTLTPTCSAPNPELVKKALKAYDNLKPNP